MGLGEQKSADLRYLTLCVVLITTRVASQARRREVSAETCAPASSSDWPEAAGSASPTSAVRGGQGRSFGHLGEKSPLHFGDLCDGRRHAEALREVEAKPVEQRGLRGVRTHDAAHAELTTILGRQQDVGALNAP